MDAKAEVLVTADGVWRGVKLVKLKEIVDEAVDICKSQVSRSLLFRIPNLFVLKRANFPKLGD